MGAQEFFLMDCLNGYNSVNILKNIEWHIYINGSAVWYVSYISIKLLKKKAGELGLKILPKLNNQPIGESVWNKFSQHRWWI